VSFRIVKGMGRKHDSGPWTALNRITQNTKWCSSLYQPSMYWDSAQFEFRFIQESRMSLFVFLAPSSLQTPKFCLQISYILCLFLRHPCILCRRKCIISSNVYATVLIFTYIPCILIIIKLFSPNDTQFYGLKNNINFALKLTLKSSHMFRCETPSSGNIPSEPC
jgi:hypothetical protein